jgi:hypothetical protein
MTLLSKQTGLEALNLIALAGFIGLLLLSFPVVSKASSHNSCSTSTVSIYSDFGDLDVESLKQTDDDGNILNSRFPTPKTEEVLINNVVSNSTESVGDLTISFADDPGSGLDPNDQPGFFALTDCFNRSNPSECKATSTLIQADDGIVPRKLTAQGGGSSPSDNTDTSDITMDAELGDRVELKTEASTNIGENANAHVQAGIDITDITLEVCEDDDDGGCGGNCPPTCDDDGTVDAGICADGGVKIYVLDNDEDEDGDQLEITDVGIPTSNADGSANGTTAAFDDDGDGVKDAILYTPSNSPDTVTFDYTVSDGNGGTDTAEVTVDVTGDGSSCGPLTVRVEDPDGNLVPGVGFKPKYDEDNNGQPEQLPEKGLENGKFTYNVTVDDDPSLSKMNQGLLTQIPSGFATSVDRVEKKLEKTLGQEEPDDFRYPLEEYDKNKSKLATDPSSTPPPPDNDSPNACIGLVEFDSSNPYRVGFNDNSSDPDGDSLNYSWDPPTDEGSFVSGFSSSDPEPSFNYSSTGTYTVELTVDDGEYSDTDSCDVTITNDPASNSSDCVCGQSSNNKPDASISINSRGTQGQCKRFDASGSSDDDGEITGYDWSIQQQGGSNVEFISSKEIYDLRFAEQSSWDVTLTVTDDDGATDTATDETSVEPIPYNDDTDCSSLFDNWQGEDDNGGGSGGGGGGSDDDDNNPPPAAQ